MQYAVHRSYRDELDDECDSSVRIYMVLSRMYDSGIDGGNAPLEKSCDRTASELHNAIRRTAGMLRRYKKTSCSGFYQMLQTGLAADTLEDHRLYECALRKMLKGRLSQYQILLEARDKMRKSADNWRRSISSQQEGSSEEEPWCEWCGTNYIDCRCTEVEQQVDDHP